MENVCLFIVGEYLKIITTTFYNGIGKLSVNATFSLLIKDFLSYQEIGNVVIRFKCSSLKNSA